MVFVLDASVTMAWCFVDEASAFSEAVLDRLRGDEGALVPGIWPLEVANVLLIGRRRGRLAEAQTGRFLELIRTLSIAVDTEAPIQRVETVLAVGREYGLWAYDAAYLETAMRHGVPLATQDERLRAAAARAGVQLFE